MRTSLKILPFLLLLLTMFFYPQEVLESAAKGLILWTNYVLPALFPFFIISELLTNLGFVNFLGILLEPLMRPLFRLPGKASFIIAMTHTAGIPIGAILTCQMRKSGEITRAEGERLLAFTSNPSPGFMFGAVASGMLGNPALGIVIASSVYIANFIVGLLFRFYGPNSPSSAYSYSFHKAWLKLESAQQKNKKPIGELLGDAVRKSISTILLVGGFIVFFSVITQMMNVLRITALLAQGISLLSGGFISVSGGNALILGFMETTLGCQAAATSFTGLSSQIGVIAFLLGWGGLSVFAQVASFSTTTDLRFFPFFLGRMLHACLALFISQIFLRFTEVPTMILPHSLIAGESTWYLSLKWSALYFAGTLCLLVTIGFLVRLFRRRLVR